MRVGIDFGTSNSSAAVYDGTHSHLLPLDPVARDPHVMRSLLYLARDGSRAAGQEALNRFNSSNVGHAVKLKRVQVGVLENVFSEVGRVYTDIFVLVDENEPGRLFKSLKMELPNSSFRGTSVYGKGYSPEELIAELLTEVHERIVTSGGQSIDFAVVGRPVHYAADPKADALAEARLRAACRLAGLPEVELLYEPVGAALSYAATISEPRRVLVFDFGGGTLDVTVIELEPGPRYRVLSTGGTPIGGDALDRRIMQRKLLRQFGIDGGAGLGGLTVPARVADLLLSWQTIPQLNAPANRAVLEQVRAQRSGPYARRFRALDCLVTRNYGLPVFEAIEGAKVRLSDEPQTKLEFIAEAIVLNEPFTRLEFERMITDELRQVGECVDATVSRSGLRPKHIDAVIRTGGSSAIPALVRLLGERFGPEKVQEHRLLTGVTEGLAIAAAGSARPVAA
ncbi:MAG: Hsp70 family protein [Chloroflexota bacterium]